MTFLDSDMSKSTNTVVYFDWQEEELLPDYNRNLVFSIYFNMTSFFRFVNTRASYPFGII
jgi:hypothetical protein